MAQRSDYRQQFLPEIDHRLAIWQLYINCVNSFQGIDMIGTSGGEGSMNISRTTQERFVYQMGLLDENIDDDKDAKFRADTPTSVADLLEKNPPNEFGRFTRFHEYIRYWGRIDKLMRRMGFYTSQKLDFGHL